MTRSICPAATQLAAATAMIALGVSLPACKDGGGLGGGVGESSGGGATEDGPGGTGETEGSGTGADGTGGGTTGTPDSGPVRIYRDAHGVPHIVADTDEGALFGLGYASAQDRLLQMMVTVLAAQGRLAEFFGEDYFAQDLKFRLMGHWRHALVVEATLDAEHLALLQAYADGVNAWVQANPGAANPMIADNGLEIPTWTPAHSLAAWYRMSDLFTNDPMGKAAGLSEFEAAVAQVGLEQAVAEAVASIHPGDSDAGVVQVADVPQDVQDAVAAYAAKMGYGPSSPAPDNYGHVTPKFSHAWVVGGDRTTTGESVLVSDPQVTVSSPSFLYEWAIVGDQIHARGVSVAGVPGLLIGFTPTIAWGMTAAGIDSRDLYRLEMTDDTHYRLDGQTMALTVESETILVAGGQGREIEYRQSTWGPVVSGLMAGVAGEYAMKGLPFTAPDRDSFVAMVGMMRATSLGEFRDAIEDWSTPSGNLVVAAPDGDIFYTVVGDIPLRAPASPLGGMIAQDGSSLTYDWADIIPNEYKPWVLNPAEGALMSANHRAVGDWYPLPLGAGQGAKGETIRSRRLRELLDALPSVVEPGVVLSNVQWDCVNNARRDLVAVGAHVQSLQPGRLSSSTLALLSALEGWRAAGGTMLTAQSGVGLAAQISTNFRITQTGPVLAAQFGGGQSGLSLFLDTVTAQIASNPTQLPSDEIVAYVDAQLAGAWDAAIASEPDPQLWDAAYAVGATPTLQYLAGFDLQGGGFGPSLSAPTLGCADADTIWSQRSEAYTQFVSLAAVDASQTLLAPGNVEVPDADAWDSQIGVWADGTLKTTALSVATIEALGSPLDLPMP